MAGRLPALPIWSRVLLQLREGQEVLVEGHQPVDAVPDEGKQSLREVQIPGGMLSNLLSQLKSLNKLDKFDEALLETPRVRADMGYPPLVTPTSQLIGTQAVQNVLAGERYKKHRMETTPLLQSWVDKKWLGFQHRGDHGELDLSERLLPFVRDGIDWLMPFYEYFLTLPELEEHPPL
jgi:hypothetical protein